MQVMESKKEYVIMFKEGDHVPAQALANALKVRIHKFVSIHNIQLMNDDQMSDLDEKTNKFVVLFSEPKYLFKMSKYIPNGKIIELQIADIMVNIDSKSGKWKISSDPKLMTIAKNVANSILEM